MRDIRKMVEDLTDSMADELSYYPEASRFSMILNRHPNISHHAA